MKIVKVLLYLWLCIFLLNEHKGLSVSLDVGYVGLDDIDIALGFTTIRVVGNLDVKNFSIFVIRVDDKFHSERALSFDALLEELSDIIGVFLVVDHYPLLFAHFQRLG